MKVLITGVAGFLGSHLADYYLATNNEVIGIDNLVGGYRDNVPEGVLFYAYDLSDLELIKPLFNSVDLVIHSACTAYEGLSVFSPNLIVKNTTQISASVLSAASSAKVKKFVYLSSMARYGYQEIVPFVESMTPNPQDPYGIAKYASELLVKNICDNNGAVTRFVLVSKPGALSAPTGHDRTSLALYIDIDHAGALLEILTEFAKRDVNLTFIQSRPTGRVLGDYHFIIDAEGHVNDPSVSQALEGLREICDEIRFLGSYPRESSK